MPQKYLQNSKKIANACLPQLTTVQKYTSINNKHSVEKAQKDIKRSLM